MQVAFLNRTLGKKWVVVGGHGMPLHGNRASACSMSPSPFSHLSGMPLKQNKQTFAGEQKHGRQQGILGRDILGLGIFVSYFLCL